jgi:hypothetical protein
MAAKVLGYLVEGGGLVKSRRRGRCQVPGVGCQAASRRDTVDGRRGKRRVPGVGVQVQGEARGASWGETATPALEADALIP